MRKFVDLTNQRFGYLVALRRDGNLMRPYKLGRKRRGNLMWLCRCDCGQEVRVRSQALTTGRRKACAVNGHRWREWIKDIPPGLIRTNRSEYGSWRSMHARCYDSKHRNFKNYGARGIIVCDEWFFFENFLGDMGRKPTSRYTIERKNNDGNYEKNNCHWATQKEQARNLRRSVYVEHNGERRLLMDVADSAGLNRQAVYGRLKNGWALEDALTIPLRPKKKNRRRKKM